MSDPLERLSDLGDGIQSPDPAQIRSRAHAIMRGRRVAVAASAGAALAAIVVVAAVALPSGRDDRQTASGISEESTSAPDVAARLAGKGERSSSPGAATDGESPPSQPQAEADSAAALTSGSAGVSASDGGQPPLKVTVLVSQDTATQHRFTLRVCNTSADTATQRSFSTAQRFDFEVYEGEAGTGEPVWRWAQGRLFAQVTGTETWRPGECRDDWTATWEGSDGDGDPVGPGRYEVVGAVTAPEPQRSEPAEVCHVTCG